MPQHKTLHQPKRPWRVLDWNAPNAACYSTFADKDKAVAMAQDLANHYNEPKYVRNGDQVVTVEPEPADEQ